LATSTGFRDAVVLEETEPEETAGVLGNCVPRDKEPKLALFTREISAYFISTSPSSLSLSPTVMREISGSPDSIGADTEALDKELSGVGLDD